MPVSLSCNYTHKSLAPLPGVEVHYHSVSVSEDEVLGFFLRRLQISNLLLIKYATFKEIIIKS